MPDNFDPTAVPAFPVVTLDLTDDSSVLVNGRPVDIGMDEPPTDAGIAAVAELVREQGISAVRVRATSPDGPHLLVVTAAGEAHDITPPPEPTRTPPSRQRKIIAALAGFVIVALVAIGAVAAISTLTHKDVAIATASPTPVGAGSNLPVVAPPGYSQQADFAIPVTANTQPLVLSDGRVVVEGAGGNLAIIDGDTGQRVWSGKGAPSSGGTLHATSVQNQHVLASASSESIEVWQTDIAGTKPTKPFTFDIGTESEVTYLGSAPLITLGDQTVAMLTSNGVVRRDVPVTATAILATQNSVIAANANNWWTIPEAGAPHRSALPAPSSAKGAPELLTAADDDHLIVIWPTKKSTTDVATIVDLKANTIVSEANVPADSISSSSSDEPLHAARGTTVTLGQLYVDYGTAPAIVPIPDLTPALISGSTVYGLVDQAASVATLSGDSFTVAPFTDLTTDNATTLPSGVGASHAYVVTEKVDQTLLYALPRTTGGESK